MAEEEDLETRKWLFEIQQRAAERAYDNNNEFVRGSNEAAINNANYALRTLVLINGGAAVAILAFIGSLVSGSDTFGSHLTELASPLMWFAWGVALATIGVGLAYVTNYCITGSAAHKTYHNEHPFVRETKASKRWFWAGTVFQILAMAAAIASLVMFVLGMYEIRAAILGSGA